MDQSASGRVRAVTVAGSDSPRPAGRGLAPTATPVVICREFPEKPLLGGFMYQAPKLERLGSFREITLGGGDFNPGDGTNAFHRYSPNG